MLRSVATPLALVLLATAFASGQSRAENNPPLDQWFSGPEVHLPGWTFHLESPFLTFHLRMAVEVRIEGDLSELKAAGHKLQFYVKVADDSGRWYPEVRYSSIADLPRAGHLSVTERFFAKPGHYVVTMLAFDPNTGEHGVWRRSVSVPDDENLPKFPAAGDIEFFDRDEPFKPTGEPNLTPFGSQNGLRLDIVLNLTDREELSLGAHNDLVHAQMRLEHSRFRPVRIDWQLGLSRAAFVTDSLIAIGRMLEEIEPLSCIRISALDAGRSQVLLDRADHFEAQHLFKKVQEHRETGKVDAHILAVRREAGTFLHDFLQKIVADTSGCGGQTDTDHRVILLISDALTFPENTQPVPLPMPPGNGDPVQFYLFRLRVHDLLRQYSTGKATYNPISIAPEDQVVHLFDFLNARRFDLSQPKDFEKALPKFMDDLKTFAASSHGSPD